jgi:hypothetical protein
MTIKNYNIPGGLSMKLHDENDNLITYCIKGPMGKGLRVKRNGTHIAFTAGTGCLIFMDLVAYLVKINLQLGEESKNNYFDNNFKFIFYVSFPRRSECIGYDLCDGLEKIC